MAGELNEAQRHEISDWLEAHLAGAPESVRSYFSLQQKYLRAGSDFRQRYNEAMREMRRAMGITPSSERRRSKNPLAHLPRASSQTGLSEPSRLAQQKERSEQLSQWHMGLGDQHTGKVKRLERRLAKMNSNQPPETEEERGFGEDEPDEVDEDTPLEAFKLTEAQKAAAKVQAKDLG